MTTPFTDCIPSRPLRSLALLACALLAGAGVAWAESADRYKPLNFAADSARVDEARKVNVLTGNVEITKGSMVFRAARVEVRQNADGTQGATATGSVGSRAYFRQKRDGVDEFIEGEGETVEYNGRADTVRFTGRAVMRRLQGARVTDEVVGQAILYDNKTEVFQVLGGASGSSAGGAGGGRVRGVITPRSSGPAATQVVPAPAPADASALKPTPSLSRPQLESPR